MRDGENPKGVLPRWLGGCPEHGFGEGAANIAVLPCLARVAGEVLSGERRGYGFPLQPCA